MAEAEEGEVRAYVVGDDGKTLDMKSAYTQASRGSRAMSIDQRLEGQYLAGRVLCPPYDIEALCMLPEESSILPQCITAYVTNVAGFGWDLSYIGAEGHEQDTDVQDEKQTVEAVFRHEQRPRIVHYDSQAHPCRPGNYRQRLHGSDPEPEG